MKKEWIDNNESKALIKYNQACSVVVNKFRSKRTAGQADMTLALSGQNLFKYLGIL